MEWVALFHVRINRGRMANGESDVTGQKYTDRSSLNVAIWTSLVSMKMHLATLRLMWISEHEYARHLKPCNGVAYSFHRNPIHRADCKANCILKGCICLVFYVNLSLNFDFETHCGIHSANIWLAKRSSRLMLMSSHLMICQYNAVNAFNACTGCNTHSGTSFELSTINCSGLVTASEPSIINGKISAKKNIIKSISSWYFSNFFFF